MDAERLPGTTELLLRHVPTGRRALIVDAPDVASVERLASAVGPGSTFLFRDYSAFRRVTGVHTVYGAWHAEAGSDLTAIFLSKGRELLEMTVHLAGTGDVRLVGQNNAGIRSALGVLAGACPDAEKLDAARHCAVLGGRRPARPARSLEEWESAWHLDWRGCALAITSVPGVFCAGRLDEGTARLLDAIPVTLSGRVLDVGAGAGVIGALCAARFPACEVEMVDSSALAMWACGRTLAANGLTNARAYPSDVYSDVKGPFDWVLSNPPFHAGIETDHRVADAIITEAPRILARDGALLLVANRFLAYRPALDRAFEQVEVPWEDGRFRVFLARRPRAAADGAGASRGR